jgi:hypothetical protein
MPFQGHLALREAAAAHVAAATGRSYDPRIDASAPPEG